MDSLVASYHLLPNLTYTVYIKFWHSSQFPCYKIPQKSFPCRRIMTNLSWKVSQNTPKGSTSPTSAKTPDHAWQDHEFVFPLSQGVFFPRKATLTQSERHGGPEHPLVHRVRRKVVLNCTWLSRRRPEGAREGGLARTVKGGIETSIILFRRSEAGNLAL